MNKKGEEGMGYALGNTANVILMLVGLIAMSILIYFLAKKILN